MKDADFGTLTGLRYQQDVLPVEMVERRSSPSKYRSPPCSPECFPRRGSSHSTPSHVPSVPLTGPIYCTVQTDPEKDRREPMRCSGVDGDVIDTGTCGGGISGGTFT